MIIPLGASFGNTNVSPIVPAQLTIISSDGTKTEGEMKEFFVFKENGQWKTFSEVIV